MDLKLASLVVDVVPKMMRDIRKQMRLQRGAGLTVAQFRVMARLYRGAKTNVELSDEIGVSVAAMSRMVQYLVDRDLLVKKNSETDRRTLVIALSPLGLKRFQRMRLDAQKGIAGKLSALDPEKKKKIFQGLELLREIAPE